MERICVGHFLIPMTDTSEIQFGKRICLGSKFQLLFSCHHRNDPMVDRKPSQKSVVEEVAYYVEETAQGKHGEAGIAFTVTS